MIENSLQTAMHAMRAAANPKVAQQQENYLLSKFVCLGLKTGPRRAILKEYIAEYGHPEHHEWNAVIDTLWQHPEREFHHFGMDLLIAKAKHATPEDLPLFEKMVLMHSWWDTVDMIAYKLIGPLLQRHSTLISPTIAKWMKSDELWLWRTCLLFQLRYKEKTDTSLFANTILQLANEQDFFIRKGIGWALREYSKTNPEWVKGFVANHLDKLSPLSKKEALRLVAQ